MTRPYKSLFILLSRALSSSYELLLLPLFSGASSSSLLRRQWLLFLFSPAVVLVPVFVVVRGCCCGAFVFFGRCSFGLLDCLKVSESFSLAFLYCIVVFWLALVVRLMCHYFLLFLNPINHKRSLSMNVN